MTRPDVLLVSLGGTAGLREADVELAASLRRAGAEVVEAAAERPREWRTYALLELAWARAARAAAAEAIHEHHPRSVLYSSTTAALLAPRPGAIRFDAPAAGNRPGRHGVWQRPVEKRRFRDAPLLVPWSEGGLAEAPAPHADAVIVPVPVEPSGPPSERDITAITYGANPEKKGLDRVLAAWEAARHEGEELVVAGLAGDDREGVRFAGMLPRADYRALLRRARVFVCAPRREDYGIAQLEALADGCQLVTTASPGPYAALPLARELDSRLVGGIAEGIRAALDHPSPGYAARAAELLAPWRPEAVDRVVREAAAAAASLAAMISGQSVLITGAAHGIGAETARRLAARGARVSLVGLGDLEAVAADCPGSVTFEADVTDRDALDAAVDGTVEALGGHRHRVRVRRDRLRRVRPHDGPRRVRARDRGQPHRRLAHDPRDAPARDRAPRLHPPRRLDGGDPPAGRARRLRRGEVGRREPLARPARGDPGLRRRRRRRLLLLDRHRDGPRRRPPRPGRGDARLDQGPARQDLPGERRRRGRRARDRAPQPDRRLPALADPADVAAADPAAADRAGAARGHRTLRRRSPSARRCERGNDAVGAGGEAERAGRSNVNGAWREAGSECRGGEGAVSSVGASLRRDRPTKREQGANNVGRRVLQGVETDETRPRIPSLPSRR